VRFCSAAALDDEDDFGGGRSGFGEVCGDGGDYDEVLMGLWWSPRS